MNSPDREQDPAASPGLQLDGRSRKRVFGSVLLAVFTVMLGVGIIAPLLPGYARSLGANGILLGMIFSVFSLGRTCFTPVTGILSDRWGRKYFMVTGLFIYFLLSLAYIRADSTIHLLFVRALHGIAAALVVPIANAYVGDLAPPDREGTYTGLFLASFLSGFSIGPILGGVIYDHLGMTWCFLTLGMLALSAFLLTLVLVPDLRGGRPKGAKGVRKGIRPLEFLRSHFVVALLVFTLVSALGRGSLVCFLPLLAQEKLGLSSTMLGVVLSTNLMLAAILQVPFGILADRGSRKAILLGGTLLSGAMFAALPWAKGVGSLLAFNILLGLGASMVFPASQALAVSLARGKGMGTMISFLQAATGIGFAIGPLLSGVIYRHLGIDPVFTLCSGFLFGAALYGLFFLHPPETS